MGKINDLRREVTALKREQTTTEARGGLVFGCPVYVGTATTWGVKRVNNLNELKTLYAQGFAMGTETIENAEKVRGRGVINIQALLIETGITGSYTGWLTDEGGWSWTTRDAAKFQAVAVTVGTTAAVVIPRAGGTGGGGEEYIKGTLTVCTNITAEVNTNNDLVINMTRATLRYLRWQ